MNIYLYTSLDEAKRIRLLRLQKAMLCTDNRADMIYYKHEINKILEHNKIERFTKPADHTGFSF